MASGDALRGRWLLCSACTPHTNGNDGWRLFDRLVARCAVFLLPIWPRVSLVLTSDLLLVRSRGSLVCAPRSNKMPSFALALVMLFISTAGPAACLCRVAVSH